MIPNIVCDEGKEENQYPELEPGSAGADLDMIVPSMAHSGSHVSDGFALGHSHHDGITVPVYVPEKGGTLYPGCDTIYPARPAGVDTGITGPSDNRAGSANNVPVYISEKNGVMYPGCDVVYSAAETHLTGPSNGEVSPEYSTYDPNAHPTTSPAYQNHSTNHAAETANSTTSSTGSSVSSFFEKPLDTGTSRPEDLDENGFTPSERAEHIRSVRYLFQLRLLMWWRLSVRAVAVFISLASFILILLAILAFVHIASEDGHPAPTAGVSLSPHKVFAGISGIFTFVSIGLNVACCLSKRLRKISPLSNFVFAVVSIVGIFGWLSGCVYLDRDKSGRNLWYYACSVANTYQKAASDPEKRNLPVNLFTRDVSNTNSELMRICSLTQKSWNLGILQICFDILTFVNAVVAIVFVRIGLVRSGRNRSCFG